MQKEQIKSLLVNIMTIVLVVGVLAVGYFVLTNKSQQSSGTNAPVSVSEIASETAFIGAEIESSIKDLEDLKRAVSASVVIFSTPAFQNLQDFTAGVAPEAIGRANPFVLPEWKLKTKSLEGSTGNSAGS